MPILLLFSLGPNTFLALETADTRKADFATIFILSRRLCRRAAIWYIEMHGRKIQSFLTDKVGIFSRAFLPVVLIEEKKR